MTTNRQLAANAKQYHYNAHLEQAADLFDTDVAAWMQLPTILQDQSGMYRDARNAHRAAVEAGAIKEGDHQ